MSDKERFRPYCAVHLFLIQGDKILLSRRFNTGWADGQYSVIAGHLDGGETVTDAMIREAKEEAGVDIVRSDLVAVHTTHRKSDREYIDFFLVAKAWRGEPALMEPDKCDDLRWFPIEELPQNVIPYVRDAIGYYLDGVTFSEYGW